MAGEDKKKGPANHPIFISQFLDPVNCPMAKTEYLELLKSQGKY